MSRLPVGSSARMIDGSLTSARAMATRCCCPPDSSLGRWSIRSPRPTASSAATARSRRSASRHAAVPVVEHGHHHVLDRRQPGQQVVGLKDKPDLGVAHPGQVILAQAAHVLAIQDVSCRPWAGPGSPGCSSRSTCPTPEGPITATNSPSLTCASTPRRACTAMSPVPYTLVSVLYLDQRRCLLACHLSLPTSASSYRRPEAARTGCSKTSCSKMLVVSPMLTTSPRCKPDRISAFT